jgi:hypothetical protein
MANGLTIAAVFLISLFLSSFLISYFNVEFNGDNSVEVIKLPNSFEGFNIDTNLQTTCTLTDYNLTGSWSCGPEGLRLLGVGSLRQPLITLSQNGVYINSYHIINPSGEYTIIMADTAYSGYIYAKVKADGIYIPLVRSMGIIGRWEIGTAQFIPIPNAISADTTIKTVYNINTNEITITFNNVDYILDKNRISDNIFTPVEVISVQGVISDNSLTIQSMSRNFIPTKTDASADGLAMVANLAFSMLKLMTYTFPYHIIPLQIQVLCVLPQEFMILTGIAMFLRGM